MNRDRFLVKVYREIRDSMTVARAMKWEVSHYRYGNRRSRSIRVPSLQWSPQSKLLYLTCLLLTAIPMRLILLHYPFNLLSSIAYPIVAVTTLAYTLWSTSLQSCNHPCYCILVRHADLTSDGKEFMIANGISLITVICIIPTTFRHKLSWASGGTAIPNSECDQRYSKSKTLACKWFYW